MLDVLDLVLFVVLGRQTEGARLDPQIDVLGHQDHRTFWFLLGQILELRSKCGDRWCGFRVPTGRSASLGSSVRTRIRPLPSPSRASHCRRSLFCERRSTCLTNSRAWKLRDVVALLEAIEFLQDGHGNGEIVVLEVVADLGVVEDDGGI